MENLEASQNDIVPKKPRKTTVFMDPEEWNRKCDKDHKGFTYKADAWIDADEHQRKARELRKDIFDYLLLTSRDRGCGRQAKRAMVFLFLKYADLSDMPREDGQSRMDILLSSYGHIVRKYGFSLKTIRKAFENMRKRLAKVVSIEKIENAYATETDFWGRKHTYQCGYVLDDQNGDSQIKRACARIRKSMKENER